MAAETTTEPQVDGPQERTVPYARFKEVNERLADEKKQRLALEDRMEQLESRDKTDVERLTKEREKLEKRAQEAEARAQDLEAKSVRDQKAALVSAAAMKANFHDPTLAGQLVNLDDIEDVAAAERAVKNLAKERQYLVKAEPTEHAKLRKIGVDGDAVTDKRDGDLITVQEQNRRFGEELFGIVTGQNTGVGSHTSE